MSPPSRGRTSTMGKHSVCSVIVPWAGRTLRRPREPIPYSPALSIRGKLRGSGHQGQMFFLSTPSAPIRTRRRRFSFQLRFISTTAISPIPFRENKVTWANGLQFTKSARLFGRYSYFRTRWAATFGFGYSLYDNKKILATHVVGVDFNTGPFTHSVRFSFLKFQNQIVDATTGNTLAFCNWARRP